MSLLRIRCSLADTTKRCDWALLEVGREAQSGIDHLADLGQLARSAEMLQWVIPATEVLLVRSKLPPGSPQRGGTVLAYAVEELIIGDPEQQHVTALGADDGDWSVLAIMDKQGYQARMREIEALGVNNVELHHEALLLPWQADQWSMAWDGHEGFLRHGEHLASAIDSGDPASPPLALRLLLAEAGSGGGAPAALAVYALADRPAAMPDAEAWSVALGIRVRLAGSWDWRSAQSGQGVPLETRRRRWRPPTLDWRRLRPALWMLLAALSVHALALVIDWSVLAGEKRQLRQQMEARFRAVFPDAVAVVDPALQMRRKLAEARHAAGAVDDGDFLPMVGKVAEAMQEIPPGSLRSLSYETGRLTIDLPGLDAIALQRLRARLSQTGLSLEPGDTLAPATPQGGGMTRLTVRAP